MESTPIEPSPTGSLDSGNRGLFVVPWAVLVLVAYCSEVDIYLDYVMPTIRECSDCTPFHPYSLKVLFSSLVAIWIGWLALNSGCWVFGRIIPGSGSSSFTERIALGGALGFGLVSVVTFALGIVGLWYREVFWGLAGVATIVFIRRPAIRLRDASLSRPQVQWRSELLLWLALAVSSLVVLFFNVAPEVFYDSLHYHFAVPNLYELEHGIYKIPTLVFSSLVMSVDMIYGFALTVGNEITAKFLQIEIALLVVCSLFAFERRYLAPGSALIAALLFFTMPMIGLNLTSGAIDVVWSLFQLLTVYLLIRALEGEGSPRWMLLAGIMAGLAASSKYTGMPALIVAVGIIVWARRWRQRREWSVVATDIAYFVMPAMVMILPYLAKNLIFYQNPFYPFGGTFLGDPLLSADQWADILSDSRSRNLLSDLSTPGSVLELLAHPWSITMEGRTIADYTGPLLLAFLPIVFLIRPQSMPHHILRFFVVGLWFYWFLTTSLLRLGMPFVLLMSLLIGEGLVAMLGTRKFRRAVLVLLLFGAGLNVGLTWLSLSATETWKVVAGLMSEREFLVERHSNYPHPSYEAFDWMNANLGSDDKVMISGDTRSHYIRVRAVPTSVFDLDPVVGVARQATDGTEMARLLREQGVTHLFVNLAEAVRTQERSRTMLWDSDSWTVFEDFWSRHVRLAWTSQRTDLDPNQVKLLYVYELVADTEPVPTDAPPPNPFSLWAPGM